MSGLVRLWELGRERLGRAARTLLGLFVSPGRRTGAGLQAAAAPLPTQPACPVPGGQGVLAQLLFTCTNTRLFAWLPLPLSLLVSLLARQVWRGWGQAGVQGAESQGLWPPASLFC